MATARPWTTADDDTLRTLHGEGKSLHAIAQEMDRAKSSVHRKAAALGLSFDRTSTAGATHAKVVDAKARRAALQLRALDRVERLYERLEAPTFTTLVRAAAGVEITVTLPYVPPRDERDIASTIRTHLDASLRLDTHDMAGGATAVIGILQQTAAALGLGDDNDTAAP